MLQIFSIVILKFLFIIHLIFLFYQFPFKYIILLIRNIVRNKRFQTHHFTMKGINLDINLKIK